MAEIKSVLTKICGRKVGDIKRAFLKPATAKIKVPRDFRTFYLETVKRAGYPKAAYPHHLQSMIDVILGRTGRRIVFSVPPRHGKTTTILICLLYIMIFETGTKQIFATYNDELAREAAMQFDKMAKIWLGDGELGKSSKKVLNNSILYFRSLKGGITGIGANRNVIVDDSLKGSEDAKSQKVRDEVFNGFSANVMSRIESLDVNVVVCGTRWHSDDLQGRLLLQEHELEDGTRVKMYERTNFPAIAVNDNGEEMALWPDVLPLEFLRLQRARSAYKSPQGWIGHVWQALYQGEPPDDTASVFRKVVKRKSEIPEGETVVRWVGGIDFAYTDGRHSDYSAFCLVGITQNKCIVVDDGFLLKASAKEFFELVKTKTKETLYWYTCDAEMALAYECEEHYGVRIIADRSLGKLGNAQELALSWSAGNVYLPDSWSLGADGAATPLGQILNFTGADHEHDDFVDALSAAHDELVGRMSGTSIDGRFIAA